MSDIKTIAATVLSEQQAKQDKEHLNREAEADKICAFITEQFRTAFLEYLPMMQEAGIKWSAHMQDRRYSSMGTFILFQKEHVVARMDFSNAKSYRYEFVRHDQGYGTMVYDEWDKRRFALFLYEKILSVFDGEIREENNSYYSALDLIDHQRPTTIELRNDTGIPVTLNLSSDSAKAIIDWLSHYL